MLPTARSRLHLSIPADWPYWVGGVALAAVNTAILALIGRPWGITGPVANLGAHLLQSLGLQPDQWAYFQSLEIEQALSQFDLWNGLLWLNLGVMAGAALSSLQADELHLRLPRRPWKTAMLAIGGGFLMGYGTRLSAGCNAGALLGGIPSFSLHGWAFAVMAGLGIWVGLRLFKAIL